MPDLRAELVENLDEAEWGVADSMLNGMPCLWGSDLDLLDVGVAIASDNVSSVQVWIGELIYKPSAAQLADWNGDHQAI